jgi:hypothetical protein
MGIIKEKQMPVGLTFVCKARKDNDMLRYAYAYETASRARTSPRLTPSIPSDHIPLLSPSTKGSIKAKPILDIRSATWERPESLEEEICCQVSVSGTVHSSDPDVPVSSVQVFVNGEKSAAVSLAEDEWKWETLLCRPKIFERFPTATTVPKDYLLIVVIATLANGRDAAHTLLVD